MKRKLVGNLKWVCLTIAEEANERAPPGGSRKVIPGAGGGRCLGGSLGVPERREEKGPSPGMFHKEWQNCGVLG